MTTTEVYSPTTASNPKLSWFRVPSEHLDKTRFGIKLCEVLLSLVAFILEELVSICTSCHALYFFEFVSCAAFLFTLLLVILLATPLHTWISTCWPCVDFVYSASIAFLFIISSIVLTAENSRTSLEMSAVVSGFVVSLFFIADTILFLRTHGFPFKKDTKEESSYGGAVTQAPLPENERLNIPTDATE